MKDDRRTRRKKQQAYAESILLNAILIDGIDEALRALDDLNKLATADTVSTVSGGKNLGCTDWFVPSINELLKMPRLVNDKAYRVSIGQDATTGTATAPYASDPEWAQLYGALSATSAWSSCDSSAKGAIMWYSSTGYSNSISKDTAYRLVAVRAF